MSDSRIFFWKFGTSRDLVQSKLLYVDEELRSDLEWIYKSHVKRLVCAFSEYGAMDADTLNDRKSQIFLKI